MEAQLKLTPEDLKEDIILKQSDQLPGLFFLVLNKKTNNFNFNFLRKINEKLDIVESNVGPTCLVTTSSNTRYFSTGLDLKMFQTLNPDEFKSFLYEYFRLIGRMLSLSVPSIALMPGYTIAGGFLFALAHDYRIMKKGKEFACMNEVELKLPLPGGLAATLQQKLEPDVLRDVILTGKKYTSEMALKASIIDKNVNEDDLVKEAVAFAQNHIKYGENKECYFQMKCQLNREAIKICYNHSLQAGGIYKWTLPMPKM